MERLEEQVKKLKEENIQVKAIITMLVLTELMISKDDITIKMKPY
jgi:hypothetical protein